ncbi:hypothetical protein GF359_03020 [candidate division WOR-3 bacterium]|uniref:Uncharacterized protein n=1 Tax=candidate division WOR-3 bacterium TaxID=2052148 RepID=A0A9D5QCN3_UNCW3|nr:hypothetical protein [candidate division WOR-3 bacterium]MBD3364166.1 hypothetical protein [candidate division WOR-3 bacterium]
MSPDLPPSPRRRIDGLDWIILITGVGVLVITILWFTNVMASQLLFRLSVAGYCFIVGIIFLLKRFLPGLAKKYPPKTLLFYLIAGIGVMIVGGLILILTLLVL